MIAHPMFDHVTLRVADLDAAARFYTTVLDTLGVGAGSTTTIGPEWENDLSLARADAEHPVTRNLHIGFFAPSHDEVRAFWRAGVEAGYQDDGEPGPRPQYTPEYFGGFLLDPDGNSAEAVYVASRAGAARSTTCGSASRTSPPRATSTLRSRPTRGSA